MNKFFIKRSEEDGREEPMAVGTSLLYSMMHYPRSEKAQEVYGMQALRCIPLSLFLSGIDLFHIHLRPQGGIA